MTRILIAFLVALVCAPTFGFGEQVPVRTFTYHRQFDLKADVYQLDGATGVAKPALLMIHGGGWAGGTKQEFKAAAEWFAQQGLVPILIDYRLTTSGARWPAQANDVEHAVWWVRENASVLRIDPARVIALGGSAGGHLAAWLATTDRRNQNGTPSRVNLLVSLWGPWDLSVPPEFLRPDANDMIRSLLGERNPREASPLFNIDRHAPPALLIHGARDELVPPSQSARACNALNAVQVQCELLLLDREAHGMAQKETVVGVTQRISDFIQRFVQRGSR